MFFSKNKLTVNWAILFLLVTVQLNFFYQYLIVKGLVSSSSLGGYALIGNILALLTVFFFFMLINTFVNHKKMLYVLLLFLIFASTISIVSFVFSKRLMKFSALSESLIFLIYYCSYVFTFSFYYSYPKKLFKLLFIIMVFIVFFELDFQKIIPFSFDNIAGTTEGHINYQLVSFFMLLTWFCFFFREHTVSLKILYSLIILFLLFVSGGRSELVGFIASGLFTLLSYYLFSSKNKFKKQVMLIVGAFCSFYTFIYMYNKYSIFFESSRHIQIFDFQESSSWEAREYLYYINIQKIVDSPLLGDYASHRLLGEGAYIHNMLSAWQQFGLLGFILYSLLVFVPFLLACYYLIIDKAKYNIYPYLFFSLYVVILCVATKAVFWPYAGISLGMMYAYINLRKEAVI